MAERNRSQVWLAAACGAALGLAAGIFVSVTTEFPLAPEAGLLLGWAAYRIAGLVRLGNGPGRSRTSARRFEACRSIH